MAIKFTKAEIPAQTRESKPNEYVPFVEALNADRGSSQKTTVTAEEAEAVLNAVRTASVTVGCTVRKSLEVNKDGSVTLTLWAVDRISRPRGPKGNAPTPEA